MMLIYLYLLVLQYLQQQFHLNFHKLNSQLNSIHRYLMEMIQFLKLIKYFLTHHQKLLLDEKERCQLLLKKHLLGCVRKPRLLVAHGIVALQVSYMQCGTKKFEKSERRGYSDCISRGLSHHSTVTDAGGLDFRVRDGTGKLRYDRTPTSFECEKVR